MQFLSEPVVVICRYYKSASLYSFLHKSFCTDSLIPKKSDKNPKTLRKNYRSHFFDTLRLHVKAGKGGHGLPQKGGIGGRGGDIVVVGKADYDLKQLFRKIPSKRVTAASGMDGKFFALFGENGKPTQIQIPLGVSVISEHGIKIGEVNVEGERLVVARGGDGGCETNGFSGQHGEVQTVNLDLKLIADVGFVGFPNAGKSTLLKALSRANPKIASYPFTTIKPNIGVMEFKDMRRISLADLPGLIEGAHANVGMGHKFLKHVERTKLLLFIVDIHGFNLGPRYPIRSAMETIALLNKELELYKPDLIEKPAILALNKIDLPNSFPILEEVRKIISKNTLYENYIQSLPENFQPQNLIKFDNIIPISAAKDPHSVDALKRSMRKSIDDADDINNQFITFNTY